jgi:hypothetical protein
MVTYCIISVLYYREMWPLKDIGTVTEIVLYNNFSLLKVTFIHRAYISTQYSPCKNKTWFGAS